MGVSRLFLEKFVGSFVHCVGSGSLTVLNSLVGGILNGLLASFNFLINFGSSLVHLFVSGVNSGVGSSLNGLFGSVNSLSGSVGHVRKLNLGKIRHSVNQTGNSTCAYHTLDLLCILFQESLNSSKILLSLGGVYILQLLNLGLNLGEQIADSGGVTSLDNSIQRVDGDNLNLSGVCGSGLNGS